jgi:multidrug efflux pump subunit AcrA (membrane-fusion protein)
MLKSGMLARVTFATGYARKALMVPKDALVNRGEESVVFTVDGATAREVKLRVEDFHGDKAEVSGGKLEAGDKVVVLGNERLRDGQAVEIVSAEEGI